MRRGLFILAMFVLVAVSARDAHAGLLTFGTQDKINHLQTIGMKGPNGEPLYLGFLTSTHSFLLPYSMSDGGYVFGIHGVSDKYYPLAAEKLQQMQRAGVLPTPLPVYRKSTIDYVFGYALWPALLIIGVMCFFQSRRRDSEAYETRSA